MSPIRRVRLISMDDPYPVAPGTEGSVIDVDDTGTLYVRWDDGSCTGLLPGVDCWDELPSQEDPALSS